MLGTDTGVIKTGRNGVRGRDLSGFVLENVREGPLQNTGGAAAESRRMVAKGSAAAAGLDTDQLDALILHEIVKDSHRIRTTANAGDDRIRETSFDLAQLRTRLASDDRLKI